MNKWQEISSAPTDGTWLRLFPAPQGDGEALGYWTSSYGGVWYCVGIGHLNGTWQPLAWREREPK